MSIQYDIEETLKGYTLLFRYARDKKEILYWLRELQNELYYYEEYVKHEH